MFLLRTMSRLRNGCKMLVTMSILAGCVTIPTTKDQPAAEIGAPLEAKYVPCLQDSTIPFHAPINKTSPPETAANIYDTPETINKIREHNAAVREACDK